jgi:hypothetical protein
LSTIEAFANSRADHGLSPLEAGAVYVPVFCTTTTTTTTALTGIGMAFTLGIISDACENLHSGDASPSAIPSYASAGELLSIRTGSIA